VHHTQQLPLCYALSLWHALQDALLLPLCSDWLSHALLLWHALQVALPLQLSSATGAL
jgi:hypothetical protein